MHPPGVAQKNASFLKRCSNAARGIARALRNELSFRTQAFCLIILILFSIVVRPSALWCAAFAISATLVLTTELINTAVEAILDKIHPDYANEIGFAKDCLAGAVLIASASALLTFILFVCSWLKAPLGP